MSRLALWLGGLVLAVYLFRFVHDRYEVMAYVLFGVVVLWLLGREFVGFINGFYEWHLDQRVNSALKEINGLALEAQTQAHIDKLELDFSTEFSETFKRQLRDSPTFKATVMEAKKLAEEMVAFSAVSHTDEERDAFRKAWHVKTEKFAEQVAEGDPLAVEVILRAIMKESKGE